MNDTPEWMARKQFEIIYAKPKIERFMMAIEMAEAGRLLIENRLKLRNSSISTTDLRVEMFKTMYADTFSVTQMLEIEESMRRFHAQKTQNSSSTRT
jgi:hypothetical protein